MLKNIVKTALFLVSVVIVFPVAAEQAVPTAETSAQDPQVSEDRNADTARKNDQAASKFVPSEKLRADDAISFPTDI